MRLMVAALESEARPLLSRYRLRANATAGPFRLYRNANTALVVSGMGRVNAAAASAYLGTLAGPGVHSWLNIGIGGQRDYALGSAWLAHCITLPSAALNWYPPLVFAPPCPSTAVCTVDRPEFNYPSDMIYEMEAAGFYPTASRFSSGELVQCLKVISDNTEHSAERLQASDVSGLIDTALAVIDDVLEALQALATELEQAERFLSLPELPWRASVSQQHHLRELLRRYRLRFGTEPCFSEYRNIKACLADIRQKLQQK